MASARSQPDLTASRDAAALRPHDAGLALAHGAALRDAGRLPEAIAEFQRALRIDRAHAPARLALGRAWLEAGEPDRALEVLARLEEDGEVQALIAQAHAMKTRARADEGYVRHLFDQFAARYDAHMTGPLAHAAPQILRRLFDLVLPGRRDLDILDLGCGTGLCGAAFRDVARTLDGIDLSPAMIERARARNLYDRLVACDIEAALGEDAPSYDLMLASDVFVYLGDLQKSFCGAARRLHPNGALLFTVERKEGDGFELGPKRRWRHSESYLRDLAGRTGLDVAGLVACHPRREAGAHVDGLAVALMRAP